MQVSPWNKGFRRKEPGGAGKGKAARAVSVATPPLCPSSYVLPGTCTLLAPGGHCCLSLAHGSAVSF